LAGLYGSSGNKLCRYKKKTIATKKIASGVDVYGFGSTARGQIIALCHQSAYLSAKPG